MDTRAVTLHGVARQANVSPATVSGAFKQPELFESAKLRSAGGVRRYRERAHA
jgi:hypothetical protein